MSDARAKRGAAAEAYVARRLEREGYRILERNWFARVGELDIVALQDDVLVFVEVRVRKGLQVGYADESITRRKLSNLMKAAQRYIQTHQKHEDRFWRVDFVAITLDQHGAMKRYHHYENLTLD
jgi:putative endonuclease